MTEDEALEISQEGILGTNAHWAKRKVENAISNPNRWEESLEIIRRIHGEEEVLGVLKFCENPKSALWDGKTRE